MKERPILFSGPMVRAILEGQKTMTRRTRGLEDIPSRAIIKTTGVVIDTQRFCVQFYWEDDFPWGTHLVEQCPYGKPGDRLWVRESFAPDPWSGKPFAIYRADYDEPKLAELEELSGKIKWSPSIHMPRWASRILLEITEIRAERLQDISCEDALAEGTPHELISKAFTSHSLKEIMDLSGTDALAFKWLWESINGPDSWGKNPWVWVVKFKTVEVKR